MMVLLVTNRNGGDHHAIGNHQAAIQRNTCAERMAFAGHRRKRFSQCRNILTTEFSLKSSQSRGQSRTWRTDESKESHDSNLLGTGVHRWQQDSNLSVVLEIRQTRANRIDEFPLRRMNCLVSCGIFYYRNEILNMNDFDKMRRDSEINKRLYPPGTRIELIRMHDPYSPVEPMNTGTVVAVDDAGSPLMKWDNGRTLSVKLRAGADTVLRYRN